MNPTPTESSRLPDVFWLAVFAASLTSVLGFVLYRAIHLLTHHRPLGAATLAVLTVAGFVAAFAVSLRLGVGRKVALAALATTVLGCAIAALMS